MSNTFESPGLVVPSKRHHALSASAYVVATAAWLIFAGGVRWLGFGVVVVLIIGVISLAATARALKSFRPRVPDYPFGVITFFDVALKQYLGIVLTVVLALAAFFTSSSSRTVAVALALQVLGVALALGLLLVKGWRLVGVGMVM